MRRAFMLLTFCACFGAVGFHDDGIVKKLSPAAFEEAEDRHVSQDLAVKAGDEFTIVLPRLYGGFIWKRRIKEGPQECLEFVKDDQFYQGGDVRPGDVSYVAYTYRAKAEGQVKLEFRFLRARETFEQDGPNYLLNLGIKAP